MLFRSVEALRLHRLALEKRISVAPGPIFSAQRRYTNFIRLNFGHPWSKATDEAMRTIGVLTTQLTGSAPEPENGIFSEAPARTRP